MEIFAWLSAAGFGCFVAVDHYPSVVGSAMGRAMDIVYARREPSGVVKECLPEREDSGTFGCSHSAIQVFIHYYLNHLRASVRKFRKNRQNVVSAVASTARPA